jgi:hypothetical protein
MRTMETASGTRHRQAKPGIIRGYFLKYKQAALRRDGLRMMKNRAFAFPEGSVRLQPHE